jgi:aminopeptidase N
MGVSCPHFFKLFSMPFLRTRSYNKPGLFCLVAVLLLFTHASSIAKGSSVCREITGVIHYDICIEINDTSDVVYGETGIKMLLKKPAQTIGLDLASRGQDNKGMIVDSILKNGVHTEFIHESGILRFPVASGDTDDTITLRIFYHGIPAGGLIISENMYGKRTFFADNWPNRAHNWFPSVDHPSQRATVNFTITAPAHYQVIATGLLRKKISLPGKKTVHFWASSIPIPTKIMVFGAAEFAVEYLDDINGIPYSNWVYPQNAETGFNKFSVTPEILDFFTGTIGPYPFEKIANVQSTTHFGGMENAGNIFYHEKAVAGDQPLKYTIVHEMAHQWFGNSVTESDWPHLWLSEGIATWLTDYYIRQNHGAGKLEELLISHREKIIDYSRIRLVPVVDMHSEEYTDLLNPNSYQKGAWILHMLEKKMGEDVFIGGLARFYDRYKLSHADSDDFIKTMEEVSGMQLEQFFDDWLFSAGHPVLSMNTTFANGRLNMELLQTQRHKMAFTFPLDVRFILADGSEIDHTFDIMFRRHEFILDLPSEPSGIILDPNLSLLFELN